MTPALLATLLEIKWTSSLIKDTCPTKVTPFIIRIAESPIDSAENIEFAEYATTGCEKHSLKYEFDKQIKLMQELFHHILGKEKHFFTQERYKAVVDVLDKYLTKDNSFNIEFIKLTNVILLNDIFVKYFSLSLEDDSQQKLKRIAGYLLNHDDTKKNMITSGFLLEKFITNICSMQQNFIVSFAKDTILINACEKYDIDSTQLIIKLLSNFCSNRKMAAHLFEYDILKEITEESKNNILKCVANNFSDSLPNSLFKLSLLACAKKPAEETANCHLSEDIDFLRMTN